MADRDRRSNAGGLMQKLIEEEAEDDFYKTTYGGFDEEEDDNEYESEDEVDDVIDSDFSIDENDDQKSEDEEDRPKKRKKTVVKTFKTPRAKSDASAKGPSSNKAKIAKPKADTSPIAQEQRKKSFRSSTIKKTEEATSAKVIKSTKKGNKQPDLRRLTQDELLAEAKITAEKNIASLAAFLKLEAEKKKTKMHKVRHQGPIVRFHSVTMPLVEDDASSDATDACRSQTEQDCNLDKKKCSRNFLIFTDVNNFPKAYFPTEKNLQPEKSICVVTGLTAKYKDPLTGLPYANVEAFKIIRAEHKNRLLASLQKRQQGEGVSTRNKRKLER
eukprot:gene15255-16829_t